MSSFITHNEYFKGTRWLCVSTTATGIKSERKYSTYSAAMAHIDNETRAGNTVEVTKCSWSEDRVPVGKFGPTLSRTRGTITHAQCDHASSRPGFAGGRDEHSNLP